MDAAMTANRKILFMIYLLVMGVDGFNKPPVAGGLLDDV
jgi:hypothetical protein